MTSIGLWIPLFWIMIIGSRTVSIWLSGQAPQVEKLDDYLMGNTFDRNIFLILISAGIIILLKRHLQWGLLIKSNFWLIAFFVFCGLSCLWSDYAFTSFKRYIKDVGNVVMALIIITETNPVQAVRAVLARYTYFAVILSILFVKYIPELGRYYNPWTYQVGYCGISTEKNGLGQVLLICGIFLVWDIIEVFTPESKRVNRFDLLARVILLSMTLWLLLFMVHSSTAILCFFAGTLIIVFMRSQTGKRQIKHLGTWSFIIVLLILIIYAVPGALQALTGILGRDVSFTGRTDLWADLLSQPINPLIGTGFQSFWQTPEAEKLGAKFYFIPNQAHNGYLEVYLQTGLIGLSLFIAAIIMAGGKLRNFVLDNGSYALLLFSFFIAALINNWTEASTNKPALIWFILILTLLYYPATVDVSHNEKNKDDDVNR